MRVCSLSGASSRQPITCTLFRWWPQVREPLILQTQQQRVQLSCPHRELFWPATFTSEWSFSWPRLVRPVSKCTTRTKRGGSGNPWHRPWNKEGYYRKRRKCPLHPNISRQLWASVSFWANITPRIPCSTALSWGPVLHRNPPHQHTGSVKSGNR